MTFNPFKFFNRSRVGKFGRGKSMVRSFAAAECGRILAGWKFDGGFSNGDVNSSLAIVRSRSRDMHKNSEQFAQFFRLFENNVVGRGFTLKALPSMVYGGTEIDDAAKELIQYHWWRWATNRRECDLSERLNFAEICRLVALNWARDGEAFVIIEREAAKKYGFSLRVVRPDACDENMNGAAEGGRVIRGGIELDPATGRRTAYYFRIDGNETVATQKEPSLRIDASRVLHVFKPNDAGQMRGIPLTHAALRKAKMLDEFNFAEVVAARDEANTVGFFHAPAGREDEIVDINEDDEASRSLTQTSSVAQKYVLPKGWEYETKTPSHPNREVGNFKNSMLRDIASGLGVEYACFANDWGGVSYSSVRAGTLAERDNWQVLQDDFITQFVTPVFEEWLNAFLISGLQGAYTRADYPRLVEHAFLARTWAWVDPMKDVNAAKIAVEMGWKTNEDVTSQYGGNDFLENCAQIAKENEAKKSAGMVDLTNSLYNEDTENEEGEK